MPGAHMDATSPIKYEVFHVQIWLVDKLQSYMYSVQINTHTYTHNDSSIAYFHEASPKRLELVINRVMK